MRGRRGPGGSESRAGGVHAADVHAADVHAGGVHAGGVHAGGVRAGGVGVAGGATGAACGTAGRSLWVWGGTGDGGVERGVVAAVASEVMGALTSVIAQGYTI
jgi:hypothetical protein